MFSKCFYKIIRSEIFQKLAPINFQVAVCNHPILVLKKSKQV